MSQKIIQLHARHCSDRSRRGTFGHHTIAWAGPSKVFETDRTILIGQRNFVDFKGKLIERNIFPGARSCNRIRLEEQSILDFVRHQYADQSNVGPDIDQSAAVDLTAQELEIAAIGNSGIKGR